MTASSKLSLSYRQDLRLLDSGWRKFGVAVGLVGLLLFPFLASTKMMGVANLTLVMAVGAISLTIIMGFAGQITLGHAAFFALGAYSVGIMAFHYGWPWWAGVILGGVVSALVGLVIAPFALRLRGLYLAVVTLGLVFLVVYVLQAFPNVTGGFKGLAVPFRWWFGSEPQVIMNHYVGPFTLDAGVLFYVINAIVLIATILYATNLRRSRTGRAMFAVRERDSAASVMGINVSATKQIAFVISSFIAGVTGGLMALQQRYITIDPPFNLMMSIEVLAIVILGGLVSVSGAIMGTVVYVMVAPLLEPLLSSVPLLDALAGDQRQQLIFAIIVGVFVLVEPRGLFGLWTRVRTYFQTWPL